jgi:hypothetical protein
VLVAILVLDLLRAVGDEVSRLAALEACPCVPPHVHPVLVQPLKPSRRRSGNGGGEQWRRRARVLAGSGGGAQGRLGFWLAWPGGGGGLK